jgi:hypothetical protein
MTLCYRVGKFINYYIIKLLVSKFFKINSVSLQLVYTIFDFNQSLLHFAA